MYVTIMCMYRTARCYAHPPPPPPLYFLSELSVQGYFTSIICPPPSDGFLRPSSCRRGQWAEPGYETTYYVLQHVRGQQLFHPLVLPRHVDQRSSRLLPHYRVRKFVGGGGELNCEAKAQVLVVTPAPLFFLKVGRRKGGRNSGAVRYM